MPETVLLTGASGFLGLHIVDALLYQGYNVLAAVRTSSREKNVREVAESHSTGSLSFVYVLDTGVQGAYDAVFKAHKEITAVIHTASPVGLSTQYPIEDVVQPAVVSMVSILHSIKNYAPQVRKLAVTSSYATIVSREIPISQGTVINENSWLDIRIDDAKRGGLNAYRVSKVLAERALWDFVAQETPRFEVTTIVSPFQFGPILGHIKSVETLNLSSHIFYRILKGQISQEYTTEAVDVRDVARAHVVAIQKSESAGKRWLLVARSFVANEVIDIVYKAGCRTTRERHNRGLLEGYPPDTLCSLRSHNMPPYGFVCQGLAVLNDRVDVKAILASKYSIDNSSTRRDLGFELRPLEMTVLDAAKDFISRGLIKP